MFHSPKSPLASLHAPFATAQDLVFVSGQYGEAGGDLDQQLGDALGKLEKALIEAGCGLTDVVKIGLFYDRQLNTREGEILQAIRKALPASAATVLTAVPLHLLPNGGLVQIEAIALLPNGPRADRKRAAGTEDVSALFPPSVRCADIVFVGAQMSKSPSGETLHVGDIVSQAEKTIANIGASLAALGAGLASVAKLNTYYVGNGTTEDWTRAAQVRSDAFRKPGPGATGVPVPGTYPDDLLVRQEAIAIVEADGQPAPRDTSWPEGVWDWPIPVSFEQGLKINNLLILGGQISADTQGAAVFPGDLRAQAKNTMETIQKILEGFNASVDALAKVTIFYATTGDPSDIDTILDEVRPFFRSKIPALTLVPLERLGLTGLEIEIEGIGAVENA